ncbi:MAG: hypothetical protein JRI93_09830 [Deltaproteobacteria bacterium]|nr:hypothetical protein [Deltaproteobacteria bacterium]
MSFKENVIHKIRIDDLARKGIASIGPSESGKKVDRDAMRELLEMAGFDYNRIRDLDLYIQQNVSGPDTILVLDNELALYRTTPQDVAMRKSPTVKEMVSIRNAIKILKDTDVVVSRRAATVQTIQRVCIENLDLSYEKSDIEAMGRDGVASLENGYADGVLETLKLFAELLGYDPLPGTIAAPHCYMAGAPGRKTSGETAYGPVVIYNSMYNALKFTGEMVGIYDKVRIEHLHRVAKGEQTAPSEGAEVFGELTALFLKREQQEGDIYRLKR